MTCRFGCARSVAVVRVLLADGCLAFPDDREQWLCYHHLLRGMDQGFKGDWRAVEFAPGVTAIDGMTLSADMGVA